MSNNRQLVAIMFADITGYTATMQEDEALALQYRDRLRTQLQHEVDAHGGKIVDFRGDGALCYFPSTIECVAAAKSLQKKMRVEPLVPLRIGIHTGDVIFHDDNIYGDAVNIASRLESFAVPGSVFISGKVFDDIKNQKTFQTKSLGLYNFKNVKEPVEIFCLSNENLVVPADNYLEGKGEKSYLYKNYENSIAVLPFINLSNDPEQEYFSDGISAEILGSLSRIRELKVAGGSSSFRFRGRNINLQEVGEKLHVDTVLEGSVRKQDRRVRVSAQLVNVRDGFYLWSEKYDRDLDDIFAIQDEIALAITEQLKITLLKNEKKTLLRPPTQNKAAYDLYLKGRFFWNKRGTGLAKGLNFFTQAVQIDENFALAHAGIADAYALLSFYAMMPPGEAIPKAVSAAKKAIAINPALVEPFSVLAFVTMFYDWKWVEARKQFEKVFEMNPRYAPAHYWYSQYLCWIEGDYEGAVREAQFAIELEPLIAHSHHLLAFVQYNYGKFDEGVQEGKTATEMDPDSFLAYGSLGMSYFGLKKYEEAIQALQRSLALSARHQFPLAQLFHVYHAMGKDTEARAIADELIQRSGSEFISGMVLCLVYYHLGQTGKALDHCRSALLQHDNILTWIRVSELFYFVKNDPAFRDVLEQMHFPQDTRA